MYFYKTKRSPWLVACFLPLDIHATRFVLRKDVSTYSSKSRCESDHFPITPLALNVILLFNLCQFKGKQLLFKFALI